MDSALIDLWSGRISPVETCGKNNPEIEELICLMGKNRAKLDHMLLETQKEIVDRYTNCVEEYLDLMLEQAFCDGFCLCSKLLTEALTKR